MRFLSVILSALLISAVSAHFTLDYPPTRGFNEDDEPKAICGGFDTPSSNRTAFPLKAGKLQITATHPATVFVEIAFSSNPSNFTQFNTSSAGSSYPKLVDFNQVETGKICYNVDISSLGVGDAKNGTNATLLVIYDGGDDTLYQCADLVLTDDATIPDSAISASCKTVPSATMSGGATSTSTSPSSPSQTGSSGAVSIANSGKVYMSAFGVSLLLAWIV